MLWSEQFMNDFLTSWKRKKEPEIELKIEERRKQNNIAHSVAVSKNSGEQNNLNEKKENKICNLHLKTQIEDKTEN